MANQDCCRVFDIGPTWPHLGLTWAQHRPNMASYGASMAWYGTYSQKKNAAATWQLKHEHGHPCSTHGPYRGSRPSWQTRPKLRHPALSRRIWQQSHPSKEWLAPTEILASELQIPPRCDRPAHTHVGPTNRLYIQKSLPWPNQNHALPTTYYIATLVRLLHKQTTSFRRNAGLVLFRYHGWVVKWLHHTAANKPKDACGWSNLTTSLRSLNCCCKLNSTMNDFSQGSGWGTRTTKCLCNANNASSPPALTVGPAETTTSPTSFLRTYQGTRFDSTNPFMGSTTLTPQTLLH